MGYDAAMDFCRDKVLLAALERNYQRMQECTLNQLFAVQEGRFSDYSVRAPGLFLDYSKNFIDPDVFASLIDLAVCADVKGAVADLFEGKIVNMSENQPALHPVLRMPASFQCEKDGVDLVRRTHDQLAKMSQIVEQLHAGAWLGYSGLPITDVVNIGIGGSDLGPLMASKALQLSRSTDVRCHFVSNCDEAYFQAQLNVLDPATTLFIVVSKSFATEETLTNAKLARGWLQDHAGSGASLSRHFIAVSNQVERAVAFGVDPSLILPMLDGVGGRYSVWSAVGLSLAIMIGMPQFKQFLAGAHAMDQHVQQADYAVNMPVILALLDIWYGNFYQINNRAVIPYSQYLEYFPSYLQQLSMESQGKCVTNQGVPIDYATGLIIWGGVGSNSQHSFHQLLMQGTQKTCIDFILPAQHPSGQVNSALVAHCLAQSRALMCGSNTDEQASYQKIAGNVPSNTLIMDCLDPYSLGSLIALYEHKVFVQSVIWDINPFDQWGVELGKRVARDISARLVESSDGAAFDESTHGLIDSFTKEKSL